MAEAGGFNLGAGYVEIDVDLSAARAKMEAFKGEVQGYFSGAVVAPVGAAGFAPSASGGGVASPAGGGGQAQGFSGVPGAANPLATPSAIPSLGGIAGGGAVATGSDKLTAQAGSQEILEAARELASAIRSAAGEIGVGSHPQFLPVGQNFGASRVYGTRGGFEQSGALFTEPLSDLIDTSVSVTPSDLTGVSRRQQRRRMRSQYDFAADPAQMYSAPPMAMGLPPAPGEIQQETGGGFAELDLLANGGALDPNFDQTGSLEGANAMSTMTRGQRARYDAFASRMRAQGTGSRVGGFGIYGAISRATGIPYAGVIGGAYALHEVGQLEMAFAENQSIFGVAQLTQPGSSVNLAGNPAALGAVQTIAQNNTTTAVLGMIPLATPLNEIFTGGYTQRRLQNQEAERMLGGLAYAGNAMFGINQRAAAVTGDSVEQLAARQVAEMAPMITANVATHASPYTNRAMMMLAGVQQREMRMAEDLLATQRSGVSIRVNALGLEGAALEDIGGAVAAGLSGNSVQEAMFMRDATMRRGQAGVDLFRQETEEKLKSIGNPIDRENERKLREGMLNNLETQNRVNVQQAEANIVMAQRQVSALPTLSDSILQAAEDPANAYRAQLMEMSYQEQLLGPEEYAKRGVIRSQRRALRTRTVRDTTAAFQRASGDEYGAELTEVGPGESPARTIIEANQRFHMTMFNESIESRVGAAQDEVNLMPMAAQARRDVARARQEVASASVQERPGVIQAVQAELNATGQLLTSQRGGQEAINVRGNVALGMLAATGVDLSGHMRDVQEAQRRYGAGAADAANAPQRQNLTKEELDKALSKINQFIDKYEPADVSFLQRK